MWRIEGDGQALIYQGVDGSMRLRLCGARFVLSDPPENGTVYAVRALATTDPLALFDSALAYVQSIAVGDTWICCGDECERQVSGNVSRGWIEWTEAHPELTWEGCRVRVL